MADRDVSASPSPRSAASPRTATHRAVRRGSVGSPVSASMAARRLSAATTGMGRRHRGQGGPPARSCWSWCQRTFAAHSLWSWCPQDNVVSGLVPLRASTAQSSGARVFDVDICSTDTTQSRCYTDVACSDMVPFHASFHSSFHSLC